MSTRDRLLALLVVVIWGMNFVVIEWGLAGVPPLTFVALRFCLVVFPAIFFVPRPAGRWRDIIAVGLLMSFGQFGLMYSSLAAGMPPGLASLVLQIQAAFTVILGVAILGEHPTPTRVGGTVLGLVGLLVVGLGRAAAIPWLALALCIAAAGCWAGGNIAARRLHGVNGLQLTVWSGLVVPIPMLLLSLAVDGPTTVISALSHLGPSAWLSTLYTAGLASLVGYGVWNTLLGRHHASEVAPYSLLVPVVGITAAVLLRGERPTAWSLVGGVILVLGVAVSTFGDVWRRLLRHRGELHPERQGTTLAE